jgi:putative sigma-54 modulation protein
VITQILSDRLKGKGVGSMRFTITGRNIEVTEGLRSAVENKLGKLEKYFDKDVDINVTLSVDKDRQKIEVTIPVKGNIIRSEQTSSDMYVSIDLVEEVIERQLKKYKSKIIQSKQSAGTVFTQDYIDNDYDEEAEVKIVRSKRFGIKPMDPEEACIQMELLGHNFFVFSNAETGEVNVVYKRKGNTYGLIEPELD